MSEDELTQFLLGDEDIAALTNVTDTADDVVVGFAMEGQVEEQLDEDVLTAYEILGIDRDERRRQRDAAEPGDE